MFCILQKAPARAPPWDCSLLLALSGAAKSCMVLGKSPRRQQAPGGLPVGAAHGKKKVFQIRKIKGSQEIHMQLFLSGTASVSPLQ